MEGRRDVRFFALSLPRRQFSRLLVLSLSLFRLFSLFGYSIKSAAEMQTYVTLSPHKFLAMTLARPSKKKQSSAAARSPAICATLQQYSLKSLQAQKLVGRQYNVLLWINILAVSDNLAR